MFPTSASLAISEQGHKQFDNFVVLFWLRSRRADLEYAVITPIVGQSLPTARYSKQYIRFQCDCGNEFQTMWTNFANNSTKSCGQCKLFRWKLSGQTKFSCLKLLTPLDQIKALTDIVTWQCICGVVTDAPVLRILSGTKKSCGCIRKAAISKGVINAKEGVTKSREEWLIEIPNIVDTLGFNEWSSGSSKKFIYKCACGKNFSRTFYRFLKGATTCGRCTEISITKGDKINTFVYDDDLEIIATDSHNRAFFICICGRREHLRIRTIFSGYQKSCGKCKDIVISPDTKYGRLRINEQIEISRNSGFKTVWNCDCGNTHNVGVYSVISGKTKSCGNCKSRIDQWWVDNKQIFQNLTYPIPKDDPRFAALQPLDDILGPRAPFRSICPVCTSIHATEMDSIRTGRRLTCGCTAVHTSQPQRDIQSYLLSIGVASSLEYEVDGLKYDLFIPSINLLIEYHGLRWHSELEARRRDWEKYKHAISNRYDFMCIFEDEWCFGQDRIKSLLANRVGVHKSLAVGLRPSKCHIELTSTKVADSFYINNHYIGICRSNMNYGAFYNGELIACMSFKTPTRQSSIYDYELVRMASHPGFRVHGIWSKLLKQFIADKNPESIVSFSDNRLFPGGVYEKLGFIHNGNVPRDYYWTRHKRRFNKSGLRKPPGEIRTESDIRTAEGYVKIWDLGKKRWVLRPEQIIRPP